MSETEEDYKLTNFLKACMNFGGNSRITGFKVKEAQAMQRIGGGGGTDFTQELIADDSGHGQMPSRFANQLNSSDKLPEGIVDPWKR